MRKVKRCNDEKRAFLVSHAKGVRMIVVCVDWMERGERRLRGKVFAEKCQPPVEIHIMCECLLAATNNNHVLLSQSAAPKTTFESNQESFQTCEKLRLQKEYLV